MEIICPQCNKKVQKKTGSVNRAIKIKAPIYCGKKCSGLARRKNRTVEEKKKIKSEYDKIYRKKNANKIKERNRLYDSSPLGRAMQKRNREKFKQYHLEYCRTPEYRKYKRDYDHKHHLKNKYGEFWEAASILVKLNSILPSKTIKYNQGIINKTQKRKRKWQNRKNSPPKI